MTKSFTERRSALPNTQRILNDKEKQRQKILKQIKYTSMPAVTNGLLLEFVDHSRSSVYIIVKPSPIPLVPKPPRSIPNPVKPSSKA